MWERFKIGIALCVIAVFGSYNAIAQNMSPKPEQSPQKLSDDILTAIGIGQPKLTPILTRSSAQSIAVKLLVDGPALKGDFVLSVTLLKPNREKPNIPALPLSKSTLYLDALKAETEVVLNMPDEANDLLIEATVRDSNGNLILRTRNPVPVSSQETRILKLESPHLPVIEFDSIPAFTGQETIIGKAILPRSSVLPQGAMLHVQLLENALAGGLSMELIAQDTRPALIKEGGVDFSLQRGLWDRPDDLDLTLKAWVSDSAGRKIYVMNAPVGYNGPDIEYAIRLESLKQGKNTKRGLNLRPDLMAQTLVQGEAAFDPVNGIPGEARLNIKLKQDRGDYNRNPILTEQTLVLRGMETRIPFTLTTDSTHFDPYAPAPFLSVSLTDRFGRVYYESGDIRAREDNNFVRLYPR